MKPPTLLVVGGTGLIGKETVRLLRARGEPIRALVRDKRRAKALAALGAELIEGDLENPDSLMRALDGIEGALLVSNLSPDQVRIQGNFVEAAARSGAPHIVKVSGFLTGSDSSARSGRWHAETEAEIDAAGLPRTFLRAPFFMQNLLRTQPHAVKSGEIAMPVDKARVAIVDARDIARMAAASLLDPRHRGQAYLVTGPEALSFGEVAQRLSEHSGQTVAFRTTTAAETRAALSAGNTPVWRIELVMEFYDGFERGLGAQVSPAVMDVTGKPPTSLDDFLRSSEAAAALDIQA